MTKNIYKSAFFKITAKTNLHVGSGSNDYGIIDNLIQRDHLTKLPIINSSSLKGALRAYCEYKGNINVAGIFGTKMRDSESENKKGDTEKQQAGKFRFFDAKLLAMPIQNENANKMFEMITCDCVKTDFKDSLLLFSKGEKDILNGIDSKKWVDFKQKASNFELPVIARNQLDNGESKNLWYEQVMPRESQFYFVLLYPGNMDSEFKALKAAIEEEPVQIGANASIGYGFCKIEEIKTSDK